MSTLEWMFYNETRARLENAKEAKISSLAEGLCPSYEDYKMGVGYVAALNDALAALEDIKARISGG